MWKIPLNWPVDTVLCEVVFVELFVRKTQEVVCVTTHQKVICVCIAQGCMAKMFNVWRRRLVGLVARHYHHWCRHLGQTIIWTLCVGKEVAIDKLVVNLTAKKNQIYNVSSFFWQLNKNLKLTPWSPLIVVSGNPKHMTASTLFWRAACNTNVRW